MEIITLSEKQLRTPAVYNQIKSPHILISIRSSDRNDFIIPPHVNRVKELELVFDDVSDIDSRYVYFDRGMASDIINFVEKYCTQISSIIVHCEAGLSRSKGVAAALSKILNYSDDEFFHTGIPNMFVYTTLLEYYFSNIHLNNEWQKINYLRIQSMANYLPPAVIKLNNVKEMKRKQGEL